MEKRSPHCQLSVVKTLIQAGKVRSTFSALAGGAALGFNFDGIVAVVLALTPKDFYKSMTTHADHRVWQDVYRGMATIRYKRAIWLQRLEAVCFRVYP
jgi:motility quorum-sensing regulator/GCU-specific mRNA interferase toxin